MKPQKTMYYKCMSPIDKIYKVKQDSSWKREMIVDRRNYDIVYEDCPDCKKKTGQRGYKPIDDKMKICESYGVNFDGRL